MNTVAEKHYNLKTEKSVPVCTGRQAMGATSMNKTLAHFENVKQNVIKDLDKLVNIIKKYDDIIGNTSKFKLDRKQESDKTLSDIIQEQKNRISEGKFNILVLGEFSCGKSTFLNALIKDKVLPVSVKPTTATINTISYSENKKVKLKFWGPIDENTGRELNEGETKEIDINDLRSHTTSLTDDADEISRKTKIVEISYPTEYCKNSVTIVDTPGFNSVHSYHDNVTLNYLMNGNAVIWLLNPLQPLSGSEREYLRKAKHYIAKILFVVPKIDLLDEDDRADVWDIFKKDIPNETNSDAEVNLYPINAKLAANGDWENSKFQEFIIELEKFLWSDSKTQEMLSPGIMNSISIIDSIKNNIELNLNGLTFSPDKFENRIKENLPKLDRIKNRQKEILQFINDRQSLLQNRIEIETPKIINSNLDVVSRIISTWEKELEDLKKELPGILKEKMMDISSKIESLINDEISYIRKETESRYQDFVFDMKDYQANISTIKTNLIVKKDIEDDPSLMEVATVLGAPAGLGLLLGGILTGPIGWIALLGGGGLFGGWISDKIGENRNRKQLEQIEEKVSSKLKIEFEKEIPKFSKSVTKLLNSFAGDVNTQMTELLNSVNESIKNIKKEQNEEKSKIELKVTQFKELENEFNVIEDSLRTSLQSLN